MERFQRMEDVREYFDGDTIECLLCGKRFKALTSHLSRAHGFSSDQYREKYKLPKTIGLAGKNTKKLCAKNLKKRVDTGDPRYRLSGEARDKAYRAERVPTRYDDHPSVEMFAELAKERKSLTMGKALEVLTEMEREHLPACYICCRKGGPGLHVLDAIKDDPSLKRRYEAAKKGIPLMIELIEPEGRKNYSKAASSLNGVAALRLR